MVPSGSPGGRTPNTNRPFTRYPMHARHLVELAALVSAHGPVLVRGSQGISESGIERYWVASKSRLDRWGRSLKALCTPPADAGWSSTPSQWRFARGVLEEIITGEVLTRVWTAVISAHDRHRGTDEAEPIARSVLIGHLEARHRVLTLLVGGPSIGAEEAVKLNRLRRRTERWTDLLIGYLAGLDDVSEFAVDPYRARDFAEDLRYQSRLKGGRFAWPLLLASLRAAFKQGLGPTSPNEDLNAQIAVSILSCFRSELFDSTGLFQSLWLKRLTYVSDDAQGMIEDLLAIDGAGRPAASIRREASGRLRRFRT